MSKRKTRERQLAKLAARRAAERRRRKRQRILAGVVAGVVFLAGGVVLFLAFTGGKEPKKHHAQGTPTPPVTTAPSPVYSPGTGKETKTVKPQPAPTEVACDAKAPPEAGKPKPQFDGPPPLTIDPRNTYLAVMKTSCGTIKFQLNAESTPLTVNSFVFLADHHYFDGQYFHRLDTSIDVVQGGDPLGTGAGGPGYSIPDELSGSETYPPGTLAMANAGANTGGSQFFIIAGPNGHKLDDNNAYTVFGSITEGLDVAKSILALPIQDPEKAAAGDLRGQQPKQAVYIDSVTIKVEKPEPSPSQSASGSPGPSSGPTTTGATSGPGPRSSND
jgi:cyclophilin family peptidyl-prolyl cis-trans isomerase